MKKCILSTYYTYSPICEYLRTKIKNKSKRVEDVNKLGMQKAQISKIALVDIAEEVGKATAARFNSTYPGNRVSFVKCDISKEEEITRAFNSVVSEFKQLDVLINNAGIMVETPEVWRTACEVNWLGLVSLTLKAIEHMRKDKGGAGGTIVNVSSGTALTNFYYMPVYAASKMAVLHFGQCLAGDTFYDRTNIRILTMCYGPTATPLLQNLSTRAYDPILGQKYHDNFVKNASHIQQVDTAVTGFVDMVKMGTSGSTWLQMDNKPVRDITKMITDAYDGFDKIVYGDYKPV